MPPLSRLFGKELLVLMWAVELADPGLIPTALGNWDGLAREERWWLYTMTAASGGFFQDGNQGWRKALRYALTENLVRVPPTRARLPEAFQKADDRERTLVDVLPDEDGLPPID